MFLGGKTSLSGRLTKPSQNNREYVEFNVPKVHVNNNEPHFINCLGFLKTRSPQKIQAPLHFQKTQPGYTVIS